MHRDSLAGAKDLPVEPGSRAGIIYGGALESLTKPDAKMSAEMRRDLIARTAKFRAELPGMLDDHKKISAALDKMHKAAEAEKKEDAAWLAEKIMSHAAMEERVLYPAALLTGVHAEASK
jgi:hypothetical protein